MMHMDEATPTAIPRLRPGRTEGGCGEGEGEGEGVDCGKGAMV